MRKIARLVVGAVAVLHGLVHLLGAVHGFGWAEVPQLRDPIGTAMAGVWLVVALLAVAAGVAVAVAARWWWVAAGSPRSRPRRCS